MLTLLKSLPPRQYNHLALDDVVEALPLVLVLPLLIRSLQVQGSVEGGLPLVLAQSPNLLLTVSLGGGASFGIGAPFTSFTSLGT